MARLFSSVDTVEAAYEEYNEIPLTVKKYTCKGSVIK